MSAKLTLAERVSSCFALLSIAAADLNAVSDELGKSVAQIDFALKNLNLGIPVWITIQTWDNAEYNELDYWSEDIGYAKINGKWGICLRRVEGNHNRPDHDESEEWLFGDAPRALRLLAIDKVPALLEELSDKAMLATQRIREKLADVQAVAAAINPPPPIKRLPFKLKQSLPHAEHFDAIAKATVDEQRHLTEIGRQAAEKIQSDVFGKTYPGDQK